MVGRIPVMDVMPVVDLGRQPAKATVGEPFPVRATVFREGHDQLAAEVVLVPAPLSPPHAVVASIPASTPTRVKAFIQRSR